MDSVKKENYQQLQKSIDVSHFEIHIRFGQFLPPYSYIFIRSS